MWPGVAPALSAILRRCCVSCKPSPTTGLRLLGYSSPPPPSETPSKLQRRGQKMGSRASSVLLLHLLAADRK